MDQVELKNILIKIIIEMRSCVFEVMSGRRLLFSIVIRGKFDNEMSLQRITFQM